MKFFVAILSFVIAGFFWKTDAYYLSGIERYYTASPTNSYLFTANSSERSQPITFKKNINKDHPLLLNPVITSSNGETVYTGTDLSSCKKYDRSSYEYFVVRLFTRAIFPRMKKRNSECAVVPEEFEIYRNQYDLEVNMSDFPYGKYEIEYRVESDDGEVVFSKLTFKFEYEEPSSWGAFG